MSETGVARSILDNIARYEGEDRDGFVSMGRAFCGIREPLQKIVRAIDQLESKGTIERVTGANTMGYLRLRKPTP